MGKLQKLDNRIQIILKNGIQKKYRTIFVMVGNKGQDQVPIMHQILNSLSNKGRMHILWCYKKELSFSTHRKKNLRLLNKKRKAGFTSDATVFEQFICSTDIRWCYYHETHKILGQTFDMCILQDFEALTPNTLARTIETVSGGGLIVFLLKSMDSLRQLCTMVMDVHSRYRTEAHQDVVCRFNERFLLSLANNSRCLVLDDRWRVLPLSRRVLNSLEPLPPTSAEDSTPEQKELQRLKVSLAEDGSPFAPLIKLCITFDQAKSLVQFCASIASTSRTLGDNKDSRFQSIFTHSATRSLLDISGNETKDMATSAIVIVTSGRGRGKSAALGLGLAAAIEAGIPNLYVTAPSPENLSTLMQFVIRGLNSFGYEEHQDYVVVRSLDPDLNQAIVRVDVHRQNHRQSLVYFTPCELAGQSSLHQADLVCVDEAAAIPLPLVQSFIQGPQLVFMASTVNGYEGTGRSLSLKLIKQLRNECILSETSTKLETKSTNPVLPFVQSDERKSKMPLGKGLRTANTTRILYEVTLTEAIRYANGDPIESWLCNLLCLDCGELLLQERSIQTYYPPVDQCHLYYVNRDTLFAYHKSTEIFLHHLMGLYVASHYKNSPNDLQLLSDAPAHHIFCLLGPYNSQSGSIPEILCVLQVCLEGKISKNNILRSLSRGLRPSGDLIPWTISQQFCDAEFGELSGARVIRIATHPNYQGLGYGSRALKLLCEYYSGKIVYKPAESKDCEFSQTNTEEGENSQPGHKISNQNKGKKAKHNVKLLKLESKKQKTQDPDSPTEATDGDDDTDDDEELSIEDVESDEVSESENMDVSDRVEDGNVKLLTESIERRGPASLPPLLSRLHERPAELLDYIGVSFGATPSLLRFWKKAGYAPVYLRQSLNELTGEFTCIMLKQLKQDTLLSGDISNSCWLANYFQDFTKRFTSLLPGTFRFMDAAYALELINHKLNRDHLEKELNYSEMLAIFTPTDFERLRRYSLSLVDFHIVNDLLSHLAQLYFQKRLPNVHLNKTQQVILLGLGLQHKTVERLANEFERLFGALGQTNVGFGKSIRSDDAINSLLNSMEDNKFKTNSFVKSNIDSSESKLSNSNENDIHGVTSGYTNWTKRIKGLLFVTIREIVKNLEKVLESETYNSKTNNAHVIHPIKGSHLETGKSIALRLEANELSSNLEQNEMNQSVSDIEMSYENEENHQSGLNLTDPSNENTDAERERRANLVRELLSEELDSGGGPLGSLTSYKVHGSEKDWAEAVVGHGSDLSSLTVKLPQKTKTGDNKKKKCSKQGFDATLQSKSVFQTKKHKTAFKPNKSLSKKF